MIPLPHGWGWQPPQTSPPIHISIYKVFEDIDMLFQGIQLQPYTVIPTLLGSDFGVLGHMSSRNDAITSWLRPNTTSNHFPHPYKTYTKFLSTLICCFKAYSCSLIQLYPSYLAQILGFWVTCGVKMMSLRHGDASPIHIRHIHIKCLSTLICCPLAYSSSLEQLYPSYLAQILGFWVTCGVKMMSLRHGWGWQPPQTASLIHIRHIRSVWALICCPFAYSSSLKQWYPSYLAQILGFWVTCGVKMMSLRHGWGWHPPQTIYCIHMKHIQSVWAHWYAVHRHTVAALHS